MNLSNLPTSHHMGLQNQEERATASQAPNGLIQTGHSVSNRQQESALQGKGALTSLLGCEAETSHSHYPQPPQQTQNIGPQQQEGNLEAIKTSFQLTVN